MPFALGALALIPVSPQLGPVAYAFVGLPLLFVLDALLTFRTCLEIDESGISQTHYRSSWNYRWGEIAGWSLHEMSSKGPNLVAIELHLAASGRQRKLTPALVQYKDANYFKVRNVLMTPYGQHQLTAKIYGGVVDELTEEDTRAVWIPNAPLEIQQEIGQRVAQAFDKKDEASAIEEAAIRKVESLLQKGSV